jgi:hypothetical protein
MSFLCTQHVAENLVVYQFNSLFMYLFIYIFRYFHELYQQGYE